MSRQNYLKFLVFGCHVVGLDNAVLPDVLVFVWTGQCLIDGSLLVVVGIDMNGWLTFIVVETQSVIFIFSKYHILRTHLITIYVSVFYTQVKVEKMLEAYTSLRRKINRSHRLSKLKNCFVSKDSKLKSHSRVLNDTILR